MRDRLYSVVETHKKHTTTQNIPTTKAHNLHIPTNLHMGKSWVTYLLMELHGTFFWKFEVFHGTFFALFSAFMELFFGFMELMEPPNPAMELSWNLHGTLMEPFTVFMEPPWKSKTRKTYSAVSPKPRPARKRTKRLR